MFFQQCLRQVDVLREKKEMGRFGVDFSATISDFPEVKMAILPDNITMTESGNMISFYVRADNTTNPVDIITEPKNKCIEPKPIIIPNRRVCDTG